MPDIEERIKAAELKLKQLKAQQQKLEARKRAAESKKQRAADTRRKILIGAMFVDQMNNHPEAKAKMLPKLDTYLKRDDDRALFGLPPLSKAPVAEKEAA